MYQQANQQRLKNLYKMLLEMATGNLVYRIDVGIKDDDLDRLSSQLNNIAEKMECVVSKPEYADYNLHLPINFPSDSKSDSALILNVLQYIQNHLEEPLPSTRMLSKMFSTNEFTLKDNFRKIVKTSIYQYYNDKRLKKAEFLILQTQIPLKEIAFMCGFSEYTNFYKSFKKKFGYTPSSMSRENLS